MTLRKYWVEAGTILYFEQQPNKWHIPRRGEYFVSEAVYKAADVEAVVQDMTAFLLKLDRAFHDIQGSVANWDHLAAEAQRLLARLGEGEQ